MLRPFPAAGKRLTPKATPPPRYASSGPCYPLQCFQQCQTNTPAGAKSTHLAVPAGAVYYFEAADPDHASKLAAALNWHGKDQTFVNRRSGLFGEKGFGLGVCGTWEFYENDA